MAGQPARTAANLRIICIATNARLLQWGLSTCPDASLFDARDGLRAVEGRQCGPWTTTLAWDLTEVGKRSSRGAAAAGEAPLPHKLSAAQLFQKYSNDLRGVDTLPATRSENERRDVLVGQLLARGAAAGDFVGKTWQQVKKLLLAALHLEAPPVATATAAAAPTVVVTAAAVAAAARRRTTAAPHAVATTVESPDVEMAEVGAVAAEAEGVDDEDDPGGASSSEEEDAEEPEEQRQMYFCCADNKKAGGWWDCPGCRKWFHHACNAEATKPNGDPLDGRKNKICAACHAQMMNDGTRSTRQRTR